MLTILLVVAITAVTSGLAAARSYPVLIDPARTYAFGENVPVITSTLRSSTTLVPYARSRFPFCRAVNETQVPVSLGEALWGEVRTTSPYNLTVGEDIQCRELQCTPSSQHLHGDDAERLAWLVEKHYQAYLSVDNMEAGERYSDGSVAPGVSIGFTFESKQFFTNRLHFTVKYERKADKNVRLVGVLLKAKSRDYQPGQVCRSARGGLSVVDVLHNRSTLAWTYSVTWQDVTGGPVTVANRWNVYFNTKWNSSAKWPPFIWYFIFVLLIKCCRSFLVVVLYHCRQCMPPMRWFRLWDRFVESPHDTVYAMLVGAGVQVLTSTFVVILLGLLGAVSPANRGGLLLSCIVVYAACAFFGSFVCGRLSLNRYAAVASTLVGPFVLLCAYLLLGVANSAVGAANAPSLRTIGSIIAIIFGLAGPSSAVGAALGKRVAPPTSTNPVVNRGTSSTSSRPVWPALPVLLLRVGWCAVWTLPCGGMFPLVLGDLWKGYVFYRYPYLAGWLAVGFALMCPGLAGKPMVFGAPTSRSCPQTSIVIAACGGAIGAAIYCLYFYFTYAAIDSSWIGTVTYTVYSLLFTAGFGLAVGATDFVVMLVMLAADNYDVDLDDNRV